MKKTLFILIGIIVSHARAELPANDQVWLNLLHFDNGQSEVLSSDFFLSGSRNAQDEYSAFVLKLNSTDGFQTACNFPARYEYLQNSNVPKFDLARCQDLNRFASGFHQKMLSIAMASEHPSSPASAFGHVMLVLHDNENPELESDAIHFAAIPDNQSSFVKYAINGIMGNFNGYFFREPLFKKVNEYSHQEQRYIFYSRLSISSDEIRRLIYHLYELRNTTFNYYFVRKNCAYQIDSLLKVSLQTDSGKNTVYTLPIDIVKKYENRFLRTVSEEPTSSLAKKSISLLNHEDKKRFSEIIHAGSVDLNASDSDLLKQSLYYFKQYKFRNKGEFSNDFKAFADSQYSAVALESSNVSTPVERPNPRRIGLLQKVIENHESITQINYRPLLIDKNDLQKNAISESEQVLLEGKFALTSRDASLEEFKFINYRMMPESTAYFNDLSWLLYSGLNRSNLNNELYWVNEFGLGQTFRFFDQTIFNYILGLGGEFNGSRVQASISPELRFYQYLGAGMKVVYSYKLKNFFPNTYWKHELFLSKKIGKFIFTLGAGDDSFYGKTLSGGFFLYF